MQTDLRGRSFISDMDFSKEEIETVLDVALRSNGSERWGSAIRCCATRRWPCSSSSPARARVPALRPAWRSWGGTRHSSTTRQHRSVMATPARRSVKSLGATMTASQSASATEHWQRLHQQRGGGQPDAVLNMQCDIYHPFQILADLMTIIEKVGDPGARR